MRTLIAAAALTFAAHGAQASVLVTTTNQANAGFTVSSTDLLQTKLASSSFTGAFTQEGALGTAAFTNGIYGGQGNQGASAAGGSQAATADGSNVAIFNLAGAFDLSSIDTFAAWDSYRGGQSYVVSYATAANPTNYIVLANVFDDAVLFGNTNSRIQLTSTNGVLAYGVTSLKFAFGGNLNSGYAGYREIDVQGTASAVPEPASLALLGLGLFGFALRRKARK